MESHLVNQFLAQPLTDIRAALLLENATFLHLELVCQTKVLFRSQTSDVFCQALGNIVFLNLTYCEHDEVSILFCFCLCILPSRHSAIQSRLLFRSVPRCSTCKLN
jgi:hypothetical protein